MAYAQRRHTAKSIRQKQRKASAATTIDPVEAQLQNELLTLLRKRFGSGAVVMEEGFADLKVRDNGLVHVFEVKSHPLPRKAIRNAIGQLLEYAFACKANGEKVGSLIVAAPGEIDGQDLEYLKHLQADRALPLHYLCLRRGMKSVGLPW